MSRKKDQAATPPATVPETTATESNESKTTEVQALGISFGPVTRDTVKEMLSRSARIVGLFCRATPTKLDDLAAKVLAKAAENGQIVDAFYDLIAAEA